MYFAHMFCYGFDTDVVGITGIRGCMGAVYMGAGAMYAIHIPDGGAAENLAAGRTFATWIKGQQIKTGKGHLLVFANGNNRSLVTQGYSTAEQEAKAMKKALDSPKTTLFRITRHLGPNSGRSNADAAAIMVDRVHASTANPSGAVCWFKRNDDIQWVSAGKAESGQYKVNQAFTGNLVPSDVNSRWWRMDHDNCTITSI